MRSIVQGVKKETIVRSNAITQSANGEACTICDTNDGTTVFCHLNESYAGKSMGRKASDIAGFFGCSACHREYDHPTKGRYHLNWEITRAMYRTWVRLIELGVITVKGAK